MEFKSYLKENKKKIYETAKKNTPRNSNGKVIIKKDDEWRTETEWDLMFKKVQEVK